MIYNFCLDIFHFCDIIYSSVLNFIAAIGNGIAFWIAFPDNFLLVYNNATDFFYTLILYLVILLNLFIDVLNLLMTFKIFCI